MRLDEYSSQIQSEEDLEAPLPLRSDDEWQHYSPILPPHQCMQNYDPHHTADVRYYHSAGERQYNFTPVNRFPLQPCHVSTPWQLRGAWDDPQNWLRPHDHFQSDCVAPGSVSVNVPQFSVPAVEGVSEVSVMSLSSVGAEASVSCPHKKRRTISLPDECRDIFITYSSDVSSEIVPFVDFLTKQGFRPARRLEAVRSNGAAAPQTGSIRSKGLGLLGKLKMSAELLIALAALLSWAVVGVVIFDFVEYKAVPDIQQIMTDPVQAVNDAVDEVSSLLNKFQECAPDLSDPRSAAMYAAEEISEVKDGFVRYFSDEEGKTDLSYIDPVVIGRNVFSVTNEFMCGVGGYIQDVLCAVLETILDVVKGTLDISFMDPVVIGRNIFSFTNDTVSGITGYIQDVLCAIMDSVLDMTKGTTDVSFIDPVVIGRNVFTVTNDFVSGIAGYIQDVLCAILDVIMDTVQDIQQAVGFSPMSALKTTAEITKEQINMLVSYVSTMLVGEQGVMPEVSIDPMKVVEDAVLEFTDKKDLFLGYMSSMLVGEQGEPVATPVVNVVTEKDESVPSTSDINMIQRKVIMLRHALFKTSI
ncbi:hypothetical protein L3Q82_008240 [Scortum barcoo]|uniref:Uncharacterized protein n=1 Tax=Scortum barcoo TaxID=214431 RepID=A0ACB8WH67_9TELE|nr:hypothetical protein L3Q82_008240 [Scortum barcoo]